MRRTTVATSTASPAKPAATTNDAGEARGLSITLLAGGPSDEREVSLASGKAIAAALTTLGHKVTVCDIAPDDLSALDRPADLVFIALHGAFGEDGVLQCELERRRIPFTGTSSLGCAIAMDKLKAKTKLIEAGVPTPRFDIARGARIAQIIDRWRMPVVVKPTVSGSSVDVHMITDRVAFTTRLGELVQRYGSALVEERIDGPELTVGIVGQQALPVIEIRTKRDFYDYQAKYIDEDTQYLFDIDLPESLLVRMQEQSLQAARSMGCRDFCRVDWMVDRVTHEPYVLEINTIPGFTSHSLLPKAAARAGVSFEDLCQSIVTMACRRFASAATTARA